MASKLDKIDVVILCGGLGKRLRSQIGEKQKTMADVEGRPFLDIVLEYLKTQGFKRIILCVGFHAEAVEEYYKDNKLGLEIICSKEEEPLGTGGAFKNAKNCIKSEVFFGLNGDCFCPIEYERFYNFHVGRNALASIVMAKVPDSKDFGSMVIDSNCKITNFLEKDASGKINYINAGIYCFNKKIFNFMPEKKAFSIENDVFINLIGKDFYGYKVDKDFIDIGTPERFKKAQEMFRKR